MVTDGKTSFFFMTEYSCVYTPFSLFIHLSMGLGCFPALAVGNNVAMHMVVYVSFQVIVLVYLGINIQK